jgi:hypothetical protein
MSMMSDHFPPERLGRAIGAFFISAPIGQAVGLIGGGLLLQWLTTSTFLASGLLAGFEPWQAAFIIIGAPGLLLVPMFLMIREPERRGPGGAQPLSLSESLGVLKERSRALIPMFAGFCMVTMVSYSFFVWTPATLQRTFEWNAARAGLGFGLITDFIFGDASEVRYSLAIMVSLPVPIMFALMVLAWRPYRESRSLSAWSRSVIGVLTKPSG